MSRRTEPGIAAREVPIYIIIYFVWGATPSKSICNLYKNVKVLSLKVITLRQLALQAVPCKKKKILGTREWRAQGRKLVSTLWFVCCTTYLMDVFPSTTTTITWQLLRLFRQIARIFLPKQKTSLDSSLIILMSSWNMVVENPSHQILR